MFFRNTAYNGPARGMNRLLRRPLHVSWLVAWFAVAAVGGIALSALPGLSAPLAWPLLALAAGLLLAGLARHTTASIVLVVCAGLAAGVYRGNMERTAIARYVPLYGSAVTLQGTVSDDASYGPDGDQRVILKHVLINGVPLNGQVWTSGYQAADIRRSDTIVLTGTLGKGFGNVPASMFHAKTLSVARPVPGDIGLQVRDWFATGIRRAIPSPQSSLAAGFLVGQRSTLPAELDQQLKATGLTHAVVASGYNLTIIVGLARQLFLSASKYLAFLAATCMVGGFMMVSGLTPSMSRAGLVTGLSLAAWYYGRQMQPFVVLAIAGAATAFASPAYVWGDIGWYLSFASFAGVIILAPLVRRTLWGKHRPHVAAQVVSDTLCAQVATLPIILAVFGRYSPYALIANVLVLPAIPLTMALTFGAGIVGLLIPGLAPAAGLPAGLILHYMTWIVGQIAGLPGAQGELTFGPLALVVSYVVLAAAAVYLWHRTGYRFHEPELIEET